MDSTNLQIQGNLVPPINERQLDNISNLPDDIIFKILSFLPLQDAVRTSALSKRWKNLRLSLPHLVLDLIRTTKRHKRSFRTNFINFIDRLVLTLPSQSYIQRFRLSCDRRFKFSRFYSWVCAVISCNVHEVDLEFFTRYNKNNPLVPIPELGKLPCSLFTSKTLVVLKIKGRFVFNVPDNVLLPNLKTLHLNSLIYLNDTSLQRLFSGCPALEDLEIFRHRYDYLWTLDISVPSLKRLTLDVSLNKEKGYVLWDCEGKLMVNAPNIEYLAISDYASDRILMNYMPSLVEAHVSIYNLYGIWGSKEKEYGVIAYGLLRSLANVKRLWLTGYTLQALNYTPHAILPSYCNLVYLELGLDDFNGPLPLPDLLGSSPKLEVLVFREGFTLPGGLTYNCSVPNYKYHWIPPQRIPECLTGSLKTVIVHKFGGTEEEMNLVKYLLKNAKVLERMTTFCHVGCSFNFGDELSKYAKDASNCEFMLHIPKKQGKRKRNQRMVPRN